MKYTSFDESQHGWWLYLVRGVCACAVDRQRPGWWWRDGRGCASKGGGRDVGTVSAAGGRSRRPEARAAVREGWAKKMKKMTELQRWKRALKQQHRRRGGRWCQTSVAW